MEQIIFYTYSTVAQVLAAIVALLGVFTIFQIQNINNKLTGLSQNYFDSLIDTRKKNTIPISHFLLDDFKNSQISRNYKKTMKIMEEMKSKYGNTIKTLHSAYHSTLNLHKSKSQQIEKTVCITIISVLLILFCVIMLPFAVRINSFTFWITFVPFFLALSYLMYLIVNLIRSALRFEQT